MRFWNSVFLLVSLTLFSTSSLGDLAKTEAPAVTAEGQEKLREQLVSALIRDAGASLKDRNFCEDFFKSGTKTIGQFVARNLSYYSEKQSNSISASCEKENATGLCTVHFYADSKGESPWACGLRFKFDSKAQKIAPKSVECIGTC